MSATYDFLVTVQGAQLHGGGSCGRALSQTRRLCEAELTRARQGAAQDPFLRRGLR
jgi:hypothetical protein